MSAKRRPPCGHPRLGSGVARRRAGDRRSACRRVPVRSGSRRACLRPAGGTHLPASARCGRRCERRIRTARRLGNAPVPVVPVRGAWAWMRSGDAGEVLIFVLQAIALWYLSTLSS
jgi:hypothetical protein